MAIYASGGRGGDPDGDGSGDKHPLLSSKARKAKDKCKYYVALSHAQMERLTVTAKPS